MDNIIWSIQIMPNTKYDTTYNILNPVTNFFVVHMTCQSWEEAIKLRDKIIKEIQEKY